MLSLLHSAAAAPCRVPGSRVPGPLKCRASTTKQASPGNSVGTWVSEVARFTETLSNGVYHRALPGPLGFTPSLLVPACSLFAMYGAVEGHHWLGALVDLLPLPQVTLKLYSKHSVLLQQAACVGLSLTGVLFPFGIMPALDVVAGRDMRGRTQEELDAVVADKRFDYILYANVVAHLALLAVGCEVASTPGINPLALIGMMGSMGSAGGLLFVVSHELLHRKQPLPRLAANTLLATVFYNHWSLSHLAHHVNVATHDDPSSARLDESLYSFMPRSILGNIADGYRMEYNRVRGKRLSLLSPRNRMLWWIAAPISMATTLDVTLGHQALAFWIGQAVFAVVLLEATNYIEHYGLERTKRPSGRYERANPSHSWNANWLFTNSCIFNLQRHSDHHTSSAKHFQMLQDIPTAPQLPASYSAMMLLALVPELFFRIMNPRVLAARSTDLLRSMEE